MFELYLVGYLVLVGLAGLIGLWLDRRSDAAYMFYMNLVREVLEFDDWHWRIQRVGKVSYLALVVKFWKPLTVEAFYKNDDFLKPKV